MCICVLLTTLIMMMKQLLWLLAVALLAIVPSATSHSRRESPYCKQKCRPYDPPSSFALLLPGPKKNSFYKCRFGIGILFQCPSGTEFNPELQVCDWPRHAHAVVCKRSPDYEPEVSGDGEIDFRWT